MKWIIMMLLLAGVAWGDSTATFTTTTMIEDSYTRSGAPASNYGSGDSMRVFYEFLNDECTAFISAIGVEDTMQYGARACVACTLDLTIKAINASCDSVILWALRREFVESEITNAVSETGDNWYTAAGKNAGYTGDVWAQVGGANTNGLSANSHVYFNLKPSFDSGWYAAGWKVSYYNATYPISFYASENANKRPVITLIYTQEPDTIRHWFGPLIPDGSENKRTVNADAAYSHSGPHTWFVNRLTDTILVDSFRCWINSEDGETEGSLHLTVHGADSNAIAVSTGHDFNGGTTRETEVLACSTGWACEIPPGDSVFFTSQFDVAASGLVYMQTVGATCIYGDSIVLDAGTPILDPFLKDATVLAPSPYGQFYWSVKEAAAEESTSQYLSGPDGYIILSGPGNIWRISGP